MPPQLNAAVLSLFRAVAGLLFLCHGIASIFGVLGGNQGTGHSVPAGTWPGWYAALIQLIAGALVLVGLATRPAALIASGSMAYAYFSVHQEKALLPIRNGGELAAMFCWSFLIITVFGGGPYSLDRLIARMTGRGAVPDRTGEPLDGSREPAVAS
ncbi:DoxX family protein [Plantactinospora siamensis]|uniref:DoxX family protein n=1 Tax=Plantactinospora siamensis TaxID=555372 RepID=A0ABV6NPZ4_9ACTN